LNITLSINGRFNAVYMLLPLVKKGVAEARSKITRNETRK